MQEALVEAKPIRFFKPRPSASGVFGSWVAICLDTPRVDWDEVRSILQEADRVVAPRKLIAKLDRR
jgi:hypothetical protein